MKRLLLWSAAPLGLLVATILAVAGIRSNGGQDPVYGVSELQSRLTRQPGLWLHRPLHIRALAEQCASWEGMRNGPCQDSQAIFFDTQTSGYLRLGWAPPSPLLATLRSLPVLGRLIPALPPVRWGFPAVYCVELVAVSHEVPGVPGPYEALLRDAAP